MSLAMLNVVPGRCSVVAEMSMHCGPSAACDRPPVVLVISSRYRYDVCAHHGMRLRFGGERYKPRRVWRSTQIVGGPGAGS